MERARVMYASVGWQLNQTMACHRNSGETGKKKGEIENKKILHDILLSKKLWWRQHLIYDPEDVALLLKLANGNASDATNVASGFKYAPTRHAGNRGHLLIQVKIFWQQEKPPHQVINSSSQ